MDEERSLPDWINGFMRLTDDSEPPKLFLKWAAISAVASALQRKTFLKLGISLTIYPNLYIVLVGPSATGKGTAMKYSYDILENIPSIHLSAQATSLQALIRRMKDINLTDIDPKTGKQYFHSSLTIFSNEFTVFLGYHNMELMSALCDWYDCHSRWTYDTISRDKEEIIGVWVNIIAGTTPDSIQSALPMEAIGGGLTSRIIFVYAEKREKLVIIPEFSRELVKLQEALIHDIEQISLMSGGFSMTEEFIDNYSIWCKENFENPPFYDKRFEGYCGRRRNHLLTLAMVCSASRSNSMILNSKDLERAINLLNEVENTMGLVFRGVGKSDISKLVSDAITYIVREGKTEIPLWQFARHFESDMDKVIMDRILNTLEASKYIKILQRPGTDTLIIPLDAIHEDRSKIIQSKTHQVPSQPDEEKEE